MVARHIEIIDGVSVMLLILLVYLSQLRNRIPAGVVSGKYFELSANSWVKDNIVLLGMLPVYENLI